MLRSSRQTSCPSPDAFLSGILVEQSTLTFFQKVCGLEWSLSQGVGSLSNPILSHLLEQAQGAGLAQELARLQPTRAALGL